jgi:hypothetical protein
LSFTSFSTDRGSGQRSAKALIVDAATLIDHHLAIRRVARDTARQLHPQQVLAGG